jgi:hypothetical protein
MIHLKKDESICYFVTVIVKDLLEHAPGRTSIPENAVTSTIESADSSCERD